MSSESASRDWYHRAAIAVIGFFLLSSLWVSYHRLGWYDEVLTFLISRLPHTTFSKALAGAASALPPGYFLLARLFDGVLGPSDGAMRIPSALALAGGLWITFECARRATDNLHGLAAVALLTTSLLPYYGYEARPYAACFFLMAVGFWLWIHPDSDRKAVAALFGAAFLVAFALHYYSVLCLAPYVLFEFSQARRWRFPSAKLAVAGFGVLCGAAMMWPHMREARKFSPSFWSPPTLPAFRQVYGELFPYGMLIAAAALIWIACAVRFEKCVVLPMLPVERLGWLFLSVPMAGFLLAKMVTNAFCSRHFIGMLAGVGVAFACMLWRRFGSSPRVTTGIIVLLLSVSVGRQVKVVAQPETIEPPPIPNAGATLRAMLGMETALIRDGKTIVIPADNTLCLEARYYSKHPEFYVFLLSPKPGPLGPARVNMARFMPVRFWSMDDLREHAPNAVLIDPSEVALQVLREEGISTRTLDGYEPRVVYLAR
jgi:hypothetical protein